MDLDKPQVRRSRPLHARQEAGLAALMDLALDARKTMQSPAAQRPGSRHARQQPTHRRPSEQYAAQSWGTAPRARRSLARSIPPQRSPLFKDEPHVSQLEATGSGWSTRARWIVFSLITGFSLAAIVSVWFAVQPEPLLVLLLGAAAFNLTISALETRWRLHAWRTPEAAERIAWPKPVKWRTSSLSFSLIVAARDEAAVIGDTLRGLLRQQHPRCKIVVTLCDDDDVTIAAVKSIVRRYPDRIKLVIGHYDKPSKAQQLNTALAVCTGDVVGVFDAEDDVAESLLLHVEALFRKSGADVVQGGVQLMNLGDRLRKWFQVHNVLEYYFWFTSRMAYQADAGFVPLGGNTVFVYRQLLEEAGGWPLTLTEDCSLGVLLSTQFGAKVATAYSPELSTREESPPTLFNKRLGSLFWQRDRWVRGFLVELMGGAWLKMPTFKQRALAGYVLAAPVLQGASSVLLPMAVLTALFAQAPIGVAMLMFVPIIPIGITILTLLLGLRDFARTYKIKASFWHYASVLFLSQIYQLILMASALMAIYKASRGDMNWYKTGRVAEHRGHVPVQVGAAFEGATS
jgi:glycosyltransferase XagB